MRFDAGANVLYMCCKDKSNFFAVEALKVAEPISYNYLNYYIDV